MSWFSTQPTHSLVHNLCFVPFPVSELLYSSVSLTIIQTIPLPCAGGVSISLFSSFESWVVGDQSNRGYDLHWCVCVCVCVFVHMCMHGKQLTPRYNWSGHPGSCRKVKSCLPHVFLFAPRISHTRYPKDRPVPKGPVSLAWCQRTSVLTRCQRTARCQRTG